MPGPYRAAMGKRDVTAGWRAAYMRPLQMPGRLAATIVGGGVMAPCPLAALHKFYTTFTLPWWCSLRAYIIIEGGIV